MTFIENFCEKNTLRTLKSNVNSTHFHVQESINILKVSKLGIQNSLDLHFAFIAVVVITNHNFHAKYLRDI